jgi:hypothetical protein
MAYRYGHETWSLTVKDEHRLMEPENGVPRRTFGLKGDGRMGRWRKLHNEELPNARFSPK